ncbi:MAG: phosphoserine phosphatase SerB [Pseudomonadota bacterium]
MSLVATVIVGSDDPRLDDTMFDGLARQLDAQIDWLDPGRAVDLLVQGDNREALSLTLKDALRDRPVDVVIQDTDNRRKRLLVADMDSTIITVECIDVLAAQTGIGDEIAAVTARTMRGELEFAQSLRERMALLAGTPIEALEAAWRDSVALTPGAGTLIATMRGHGAFTALISGGFTWFTERVAQRVGFDMHQANQLNVENGQLTGSLTEPILDRGAKETLLRGLADERGIALADTLAVGDGANDIAMIKAAGLGVAYHGVQAVREVADADVQHGDLTALLYMQGYRQSEFRTA